MAGGGRRKRASKNKNNPKARQSVKDHFAYGQNESPLSEELIALSSIFQDDFTLISNDAITEFSINVQPHSSGDGSFSGDICAELHVRCFPGYPYKPPKLQVKAEAGVSEEDLRLLHSMLADQASSSSREGRVMIFNLVEAAQEFLSEHVRCSVLEEGIQEDSTSTTDSWIKVPDSSPRTLQDNNASPVFGIIDLFTELRDDIHWKGEPQQMKQKGLHKLTGSSLNSISRRDAVVNGLVDVPEKIRRLEELSRGIQDRNKVPDQYLLLKAELEGVKQVQPRGASAKLIVAEEKEEDASNQRQPLQFTSVSELLDNVCSDLNSSQFQNLTPPEQELRQDGSVDSVRKDFLLAHLLRLVCCPKGPLPHAWPTLALQLQKLNVIPQWITDLVVKQPQLFDLAFCRIFVDCIKETNVPFGGPLAAKRFWTVDENDLNGKSNILERASSRYANDFEEISLLGRGGFGYVVLCRNNLDGRRYAVKKIRLKDRKASLDAKILREVATLSRLQHHHIVRYYQAWFETMVGVADLDLENESSSDWMLSSREDKTESRIKSLLSKGLILDDVEEKFLETTWLYIQMEYCPRTLRQVLDAQTEPLNEVTVWGMFRQIVEGLAHIHAQGIIHRDLTPSNIFFDVCNDIKIGDFGLAKFTNLEQTERETSIHNDQNGGSLDGTGQVGTYFYTAPEVEKCWPQIDEKVDMYSLGIILFELWHPFSTAMERHIVLTELKAKGPPLSWATKFPHQAGLVQSLIALNPADRPSAMQVLRNSLPPRMEDEAVEDVLRTIQRAENSYVVDQIISSLFDEERMSLIAQKLDQQHVNYLCSEKSFLQDQILAIAKDVFASHGAQQFSSQSLNLIDDDGGVSQRQTIKLIDSAGRMLYLRSDMRTHFAHWVTANQVASIKRFEIAQVYRKGTGPSAPEEYYQGDFDIVGETYGLAEAEAIKVVVDIIQKCAISDLYEIRINHPSILEAIWTWSGVRNHERRDVAKLLSSAGCASPQSSDRKSRWVYIRQQLMQGLQLPEVVVDRLQTVERRWNGPADEALPRLRGGLADSSSVSSAIDELSTLQSYLRVWNMGRHVHVDALMAPLEEYCGGVYFQIYIPKGGCHATSSSGMLVAVGGRYDLLLQKLWPSSLVVSTPGAAGVSIALEKLILAAESESHEPDTGVEVLVCSKGGGGLLKERMEVVSKLWDGNIKADFVHTPSPSVTEQYEYANEHGIKWLVMITEAGLTHGDIKVRNMESRKDEDISMEELVKFFTDIAVSSTNRRGRYFSGK